MSNKYDRHALIEHLEAKRQALVDQAEKATEANRSKFETEWLPMKIASAEETIESGRKHLAALKKHNFGIFYSNASGGRYYHDEPVAVEPKTGELDKALLELRLMAADEVTLTSANILKLL